MVTVYFKFGENIFQKSNICGIDIDKKNISVNKHHNTNILQGDQSDF